MKSDDVASNPGVFNLALIAVAPRLRAGAPFSHALVAAYQKSSAPVHVTVAAPSKLPISVRPQTTGAMRDLPQVARMRLTGAGASFG
jgi:hypothetical protein